VLSGSGRPTPHHRPAALWAVADHACRHCLGRVLQRVVRGVAVEVRCAQCGQRADGGPSALCCCGADCGALGYALECFKNTNVTQAVPHEIMVRERGVLYEPQGEQLLLQRPARARKRNVGPFVSNL
jgi:hypothetical protein